MLGYTPLMLVITFFGGLTALGLGIIGQYLWLSLQNARNAPELHREAREVRSAARSSRANGHRCASSSRSDLYTLTHGHLRRNSS